ncbi:hypothetical protein [Kitasatospora sp. P5_F3]
MTALDVLTEFGRTGLIGPVGCRVPLPELAAALGPPWVGDPVDKRRRWPHWFGYGDLQLVVCQCRLVTMVIVPAWHGEVEYPVAGTFESELPLSTVLARLDALDVPWTRDDRIDGQCTVLTEPGGVTVSFCFTTRDDYDGPLLADPVLNKVVSHDPHDCPPIPAGTPDDGYGV